MSLRDRLHALRDRFLLIEWGVAVFAIAILLKAAHVQLLNGPSWAKLAAGQHTRLERLPAPRGRMIDATGMPLVESRELVSFNIAPREVRRTDRALLARTLSKLRAPQPYARRALDTNRKWVNLPGRYPVSDAGPMIGMRGVYATYEMARLMAIQSRGVRAVVGGLDGDHAISGLELALDTLLQGVTGSRQLIKTGRGDRLESPDAPIIAPVSGSDLTLSINYGVQDIAEQALERAVAANGADGGDVVVLDPRSGEIVALASRTRTGVATKLTAVTDPYEPGSTLKPFIVAQLLADGRTRPEEVINTFNGTLNYRGIRKITDAHVAPRMTVTEVLAQSSNIGIVTLRDRMQNREHYELLRNLGFGAYTGLSYPGESMGRLRPLGRWDQYTPSSLAMGYELTVTPLQLALAYGAIANDGLLMEPTLIREIRSPDGKVRWRHRPRIVRRVFSPAVAQAMREVLEHTITEGTGKSASLTKFALAGKSGTTKLLRNGSYNSGDYTASFVGLFPADAPQLVILAKLDRPRGGQIYGGLVAAPILKAIIEGAFASTRTAIDRRALATQVIASPIPTEPDVDTIENTPEAAVVRVARRSRNEVTDGAVPYVMAIAPAAPRARPVPAAPRTVPSVQGMSLRDALFALHERGFRVL
ncbi:MAG TPA: penicillin-binding protein 2, partial [Gemmatimonadaceae bacterium]|nr:penicillin-binding protein 2 [Gemmatimonadaceae bacterium]